MAPAPLVRKPLARRGLRLPPVWASVLAAAVLDALWWRLSTTDMAEFLLPWLAHVRQHGPIGSFAAPFSNYAPPYLYLLAAISPLAAVLDPVSVIKLLSVSLSGVLALAVARLLRRLPVTEPDRAAAAFLLLPTVAINAGLLGQCDALWAAPLVMALAAALDRRTAAMMAWCGLAFAIKAQAALAAPFFLAVAIAWRVPVRQWLLPVLTAALALAPAALAGWPIADLLTVYVRQTGHFNALSMNAPNLWMIAQQLPGVGALPLGGLAAATALGTTAWYVAHFSVRLRTATPVDLIAAAALATLLTAGLLPRMHERFFFLADVLTVVLAVARRGSWRIAAAVQAASGLAILAYLSGVAGLATIGAAVMILATARLAAPLVVVVANDNAALRAPLVTAA